MMSWRSIRSRTARALAAAMAMGLWVPAAWAAEGGDDFYFGDLGQAIITVVIFLLLLAVLRKWAWNPIIQQLKRREDSIAHTIAQAEGREKDAQKLLEEYRRRLEAAHGEAQELLKKSRHEAAKAREDLLAAARDEARKSADAARWELEKAKQDATRDLYDSAANLATLMASKILRRTIQPDDQARLLKESLDEIRQQARKN